MAVLRRAGTEIFVRYSVPRELRWKALKMIEQTQFADRHPNIVMPLISVKQRDGTVETDTEYADAGPLHIYIPTFPLGDRLIAAKSIVRQLFESLIYMDNVHDKKHRNICPTTVFLRQDGCVKLGFYDLIGPQTDAVLSSARNQHLKENPDWYFNNPYVAPECRPKDPNNITANDVIGRVKSDAQADVWATGVTAISILFGKTFLPKVLKTKYDDKEAPQSTSGQVQAFQTETKMFKIILEMIQTEKYQEALGLRLRNIQDNADDEANSLGKENRDALVNVLSSLIHNPELAHLLHRCLQTDPAKRASLKEAHALIYLFGGYSSIGNTNDPWATDVSGLLANQNVESSAGPEIKVLMDNPQAAPASASTRISGTVEMTAEQRLELEDIQKHLKSQSKIPRSNDQKTDRLEKFEIVTNLEFAEWKSRRSDSGERAVIDKASRDIIKARLKIAWGTLAKAITKVRDAAKAAAEQRAKEENAAALVTPPVSPAAHYVEILYDKDGAEYAELRNLTEAEAEDADNINNQPKIVITDNGKKKDASLSTLDDVLFFRHHRCDNTQTSAAGHATPGAAAAASAGPVPTTEGNRQVIYDAWHPRPHAAILQVCIDQGNHTVFGEYLERYEDIRPTLPIIIDQKGNQMSLFCYAVKHRFETRDRGIFFSRMTPEEAEILRTEVTAMEGCFADIIEKLTIKAGKIDTAKTMPEYQ